MRVDFGRLILLDAIIAAIGLLFARIINRRERTRSIAVRVVFYSLVAAPIIAIVWSIVAHIGYVRYQATEERARRETERVRHERQEMLSKGVADNLSSPARASDVLATILWFRSDGYTDNEISWALAQRFNGFLEIQELGPKIGYETPKQGDTLSSLERALLADSLRVNDVDLEKLTLTEIAPSVSGETLYGFHGRIRNDLTRAVHSIRAKASIYDSGGKLAEVLTFWLNRSLNSENDFAKAVPGEPASFETRVRVEHMPKGFTYKVQVIEGHYIQ